MVHEIESVAILICFYLQEADDDEEARAGAALAGERLTRGAALGRAAAAATFPQLAGALRQRQAALAAAAAASGGDPSVPLEELCWLVEVASHCLADAAAGMEKMTFIALAIRKKPCKPFQWPALALLPA